MAKKNYQKKNQNFDSGFREKIDRWFWVIVLIVALLYLKWLLTEMHLETNRLSEERQELQVINQEQEGHRSYQRQLTAEIQESINRLIEQLRNVNQTSSNQDIDLLGNN